MSEPVELRPAYAWTCPECGRDNFEAAIVWEGSEEEEAELRDEHGIEETATGDWVRGPERVECPHCEADFATHHFGEQE